MSLQFFYNIRVLHRIRHYIPLSVAQSIATALVSSASEIIALAPCALSHYFKDLYNNLSSPLSNTISISELRSLQQETPDSYEYSVVYYKTIQN